MTTALLSLPLWMQFLAGFILLGLGLMFILMPFSIFGVKPRLEEVELQLNEVRAELRIIAMRLAQGAGETGPSGEPIYAPPRRAAASAGQAEPPLRPTETMRAPDPMPWSAQAGRQAAQRPPVERPPVERSSGERSAGERASGERLTPDHAPVERIQPDRMQYERSGQDEALRPMPAAEEVSAREAFQPRHPSADERRDRQSPPIVRDDYSYAESGAQENLERILRPTHFDPPPPREAPRPPGATYDTRASAAPYVGAGGTAASIFSSQGKDQNEVASRNDDAWRLKAQRQEMAPRGAGAEAEKLRQAEEAGARRVRSEPTLRWPPRP
ncbi:MULTISPECIES: hypothetical protein [Asaia]|nr:MULTISPECIES: hypothetical protein [Asaia]ETD00011.1 hypothetical protein P792_02355 [Asaia sp. SF2.1]